MQQGTAQAANGKAAATAPVTDQGKAVSGFEVDPEVDAINKISKIMAKLKEPALTHVKDWLSRKLKGPN